MAMRPERRNAGQVGSKQKAVGSEYSRTVWAPSCSRAVTIALAIRWDYSLIVETESDAQNRQGS